MFGIRRFIPFVRTRGLEPPRLAALEPESSMSTNSTTPAGDSLGKHKASFELANIIFPLVI